MRKRTAAEEANASSDHQERRAILRALIVSCCLSHALNGSPARASGTSSPAVRPAPAAATPTSNPATVSLRIVPKQVALWGARASQRIVVLGMFADGLERDLTSQ